MWRPGDHDKTDPENSVRIRCACEQIVDAQKTASAVPVDEVDVAEDEYNDALVVGRHYDVYDSRLTRRTTIRISAMELCRWDSIPVRLWQGETNVSADEFRTDHEEYFEHPGPDFEFVAYYFELAAPTAG